MRFFLWNLQGDDSKKGKKKKSADLVELPFDSELPCYTDVELQKYRDEEVSGCREQKQKKIPNQIMRIM